MLTLRAELKQSLGRHRDVLYFANCDPDDTLTYRVHGRLRAKIASRWRRSAATATAR
jgi:hypothetical protein